MWKTKSEKGNAIRQGIISNDGCTENCIRLRINAADKSTSNKQDNAIADTYGNKFIIPFNFEMLNSFIQYYQAGLGNRLRDSKRQVLVQTTTFLPLLWCTNAVDEN